MKLKFKTQIKIISLKISIHQDGFSDKPTTFHSILQSLNQFNARSSEALFSYFVGNCNNKSNNYSNKSDNYNINS